MKIPFLFTLVSVLASCAFAQQTPVGDVQPLPAAAEKPLPTLWIIGDSTVKNGTKGQMGWGDPIKDLFDLNKINVENKARGGRSSRTYYTEELWSNVAKELKPGDFVLMQFGHNDGGSLTGPNASGRASIKGNGDETQEVVNKDGKTETVHSFGWYLRQYIADSKAKGATPIVLSLIPRNDWKDGKVGRAGESYGGYARDAAATGGATFIDLNGITADKYDAMGQEKVKAFFPNEHTHTNEAGARINAQSVVDGIREMPGSALAAYLKTE